MQIRAEATRLEEHFVISEESKLAPGAQASHWSRPIWNSWWEVIHNSSKADLCTQYSHKHILQSGSTDRLADGLFGRNLQKADLR